MGRSAEMACDANPSVEKIKDPTWERERLELLYKNALADSVVLEKEKWEYFDTIEVLLVAINKYKCDIKDAD
jgi:hypothetical protein